MFECSLSELEPRQHTCEVCKKPIELEKVKDGTMLARCCRIERGDFAAWDQEGDPDTTGFPNIKFGILVCAKCFLEDLDLCRFFNKIGCQVR